MGNGLFAFKILPHRNGFRSHSSYLQVPTFFATKYTSFTPIYIIYFTLDNAKDSFLTGHLMTTHGNPIAPLKVKVGGILGTSHRSFNNLPPPPHSSFPSPAQTRNYPRKAISLP